MDSFTDILHKAARSIAEYTGSLPSIPDSPSTRDASHDPVPRSSDSNADDQLLHVQPLQSLVDITESTGSFGPQIPALGDTQSSAPVTHNTEISSGSNLEGEYPNQDRLVSGSTDILPSVCTHEAVNSTPITASPPDIVPTDTMDGCIQTSTTTGLNDTAKRTSGRSQTGSVVDRPQPYPMPESIERARYNPEGPRPVDENDNNIAASAVIEDADAEHIDTANMIRKSNAAGSTKALDKQASVVSVVVDNGPRNGICPFCAGTAKEARIQPLVLVSNQIIPACETHAVSAAIAQPRAELKAAIAIDSWKAKQQVNKIEASSKVHMKLLTTQTEVAHAIKNVPDEMKQAQADMFRTATQTYALSSDGMRQITD